MTACRDDPDTLRILVVGQTPPPVGGQAVMIQRMLDHEYSGVELVHVRMAFSQEISDAGAFQLRKVLHLLSVIARITWARVRHRADILYYPPAGPDRVPVYRDIAILTSTRWMFRRTIFHFHATGLPQIRPALPPLLQKLFRMAYWHPDLAIATSEYNLADGEGLEARNQMVIPNCLNVDATVERHADAASGPNVRLLFVGLLTASKGVEDILSAASILRDRGYLVDVRLVGKPSSPEFEQRLLIQAADLHVERMVTLTGELSGQEVDAEYQQADVFVFPTRGRSESFGIVLLEAMSHGLPVVGSGLGGVRSIIRDGVNGFYVPPEDPAALADALGLLIRDPSLRTRMGAAGVQLMESEYSPQNFFTRMQEAFQSVA